MREELLCYENVALSTRIRLARNFEDYPFPNRIRDEETAEEIIKLVTAALKGVDDFELYRMRETSEAQTGFLKECYLISSALIANKRYSAVLLTKPSGPSLEERIASLLDGGISVMINEEDHIRAQYFMRGYDLRKGYERISGLDDIISETLPFAFDHTFGYLTACPTNLGTGLRASVMLFLPALSRAGKMQEKLAELRYYGLTARGVYGEGSVAEGDLYQISNEVTLGASEDEILSIVEEHVEELVREELLARMRMSEEGGIALTDRLLRSYGILTNCARIETAEFMERMADVKLAVALGILDGEMSELDDLLIAMRPANLSQLCLAPLDEEERNRVRAVYAGRKLREMELLSEQKRKYLIGD